MPSNYLILCFPLFLLPSIFPSMRVFSNELVLHMRWSKCWSLNFSSSPSNEYSGLISFRINLFDLLAVQRTLSRVHHSLQFESINSFESIIQPSLWSNSHPSVTTGKIIALTIRTFVGKVISLLFNTLSRYVIAFLEGASVF